MAVDAIELSFERDYITTFVLGTGDSDFTPLVHKLRELNRRVIGIGIEASTSALLPAACDEFLFYERLEGVDLSRPRRAPRTRTPPRARLEDRRSRPRRRRGRVAGHTGSRGDRPRPSRHADALRSGAQLERVRPRLDAEAGDPPQGPDVQRGELRVPQLRGAPPQSRRPGCRPARRRDASPATPRSRSRRIPATRRRRSSCCARPSNGLTAAQRAALPVGPEDPAPPHPARLQREALRLRRLPPVLQGGAARAA